MFSSYGPPVSEKSNYLSAGGGDVSVTGTAIQIMSVKPIVVGRSSASIYDAVAKLVAADLTVYKESGGQARCWIFWNGANTEGRIAGSGNYVALVNLRLNDGTSVQKKIALGINK